jgi:hypothetical protein
MSKKRSRTGNFSLELNTQNNGTLPTPEEIEQNIAKVTGSKIEEKASAQEKLLVEPVLENKSKRIPFTTALTPENRALLEAAAHEGKENVADLLNQAIEHFFKEVRPLQDKDLKEVFLKLFEKKVK